VAIHRGKIVAVGDDPVIERKRGMGTRVINAGGKLVLPGFVDCHIHFIDGSFSLGRVNLEGAKDPSDIQKRLREYAAEHPGDDWILGRGWNPSPRARFRFYFFVRSLPGVRSGLRANEKSQNSSLPPSRIAPSKQSSAAKQPSPEQELQQAISNSGNDRAALVRNLEAFLKEYPDSRQRPQIYRALVEACLQLRDNTRAAAYAERIVALSPDDISMTILTIQLLEGNGDEAALRRATNYATRVLEFVEHSSSGEKSPKISQEEWAMERKRDRMSVLALRGRLELKLKDTVAAQKDFEASYAILPGATAAEQLGEIAEMKKDLNGAIQQYARAFAWADATNGAAGRREIRQKLGNVWRLAHGSDDGLGEYLLRTYDEVSPSSMSAKPRKNADAREPAGFHAQESS